jgi:hypothetical protein
MAPKKKGKSGNGGLMRSLNRNVLKLATRLEATNFTEYVELMQTPGKLLWTNFLAGLSRGVGMFLGAGVMGAITLAVVSAVVYWLLRVFDMLPLIGDLTGAIKDLLGQFMTEHKK